MIRFEGCLLGAGRPCQTSPGSLTSIPGNTGSCTSRHQHPPTFSRVLTSSLAGCGRGDAFIWAAHRETGVRVPISIRDLHSRAARQTSPFAEPPRSPAFCCVHKARFSRLCHHRLFHPWSTVPSFFGGGAGGNSSWIP